MIYKDCLEFNSHFVSWDSSQPSVRCTSRVAWQTGCSRRSLPSHSFALLPRTWSPDSVARHLLLFLRWQWVFGPKMSCCCSSCCDGGGCLNCCDDGVCYSKRMRLLLPLLTRKTFSTSLTVTRLNRCHCCSFCLTHHLLLRSPSATHCQCY